MATRKKVADDGTPQFDLRSYYQQSMEAVARKQGLSSDPLEDITPMSTGWLALDLMYGGGIRPAMYTHAGDEQTAKTTLALSELAQAIKMDVPLKAFWDFEGSSVNSRPYITNILRTMGVDATVDQIFGKIDKSTGEILIKPMVNYFANGSGEAFFDWLAGIERAFPDKRFIGGKWWLIYDDTKENAAKLRDFANASMAKRHGKGIWVPAPDGNLQGFVVIDAWSACNPSSNDEEDADDSLGVQARFFTKHLIRIKGRLAPKMIALIGMNHLSDIPMARFGPKQKEKGGNDLRNKSDVRIWNFSRGSGMPFAYTDMFDKDEGYLETEKSANFSGTDKYRYIFSKNIKNKLWTPKRSAWFRIWVEDGAGEARGFDPFWDTMVYLRDTGQLIGNVRKKLVLNIDGVELKVTDTNWLELKTWVLGTKEQKIEICKRLGIAKPFDLRKHCFKQVASGRGEALYVKLKTGNGKNPEPEKDTTDEVDEVDYPENETE
jgi:RecA/RadA recombinase